MNNEYCNNCKYYREDECTLERADGVRGIHGAECMLEVMEKEREGFTG